MEATLSQAVERQPLDLDRFLELWPLLTSKPLLQALEAAAGRTVSLFVAAPAGGSRIEILVDHDAGRAAVDDGASCRWGAFSIEGEGCRIALEDAGGTWQLSSRNVGARLCLLPA
jgi:ethanolamine utilization protein EutA (predicted chaperonin)